MADDSLRTQLQFTLLQDEQRFTCIYDKFVMRGTALSVPDTDLTHYESMTEVAKSWCDPKGEKDNIACANPMFNGPLNNTGSRLMLLQTYVDETFPAVKGTLEVVADNGSDAETGWGVYFQRALGVPSFMTGAQDRNNALILTFSQPDESGEHQTLLEFNQELGYGFDTGAVVITFDTSVFDDFEQLIASPELFATTLEARYIELQTEIERQFSSGEKLDATGNELPAAIADIESKRLAIRNDAPQLHALLTQSIDVSQCG